MHLTNNLDFKRAIAQSFDPETDYSTFDEAEIDGAFEATILELIAKERSLMAATNFAEVTIPEKGDIVSWKYGSGKGTGKVKNIYTKSITLKIGESDITRNGTKENPALLIVQDGARVLKLASEVSIVDQVELEEVAIAYSFEFDGKYDHIDLTPTKGMIEAAKQAKKYLDEGFGGDGLEAETKRWVGLVAQGRSLSIEKAKKGYKFFQRHNTYKDNKSEGDTNPSKPAPWYVARLCWFGDDGEKFFNRVWRQIQSADADTADNSEAARSWGFPPEVTAEPRRGEPLDFGSIIHNVIKWNGFDIGTEYRPGEVRFPGRRNSKKLRSGYGHLRGLKSSEGDKEALDCYLAPAFFNGGTPSDRCFEISQISPEDGDFNEYKEMIGYESIEDARAAYLQEMPEEYFGDIREISLEELAKYRVKSPNFAEMIEQAIAPHLQKLDSLIAKLEFGEPIKLEGEILEEDEYEAIASDDEVIEKAVEDWADKVDDKVKNLIGEELDASRSVVS